MLRLIGIVVSIGLADSLDPTTLGPGLYLSLSQRPAHRVLQFAAGVFLVMVVGGLVVVLGPGQLLLHLVPRPRKSVEYSLEVGVGVALIVGALVLWRFRSILAARELFRAQEKQRRSSLLLGVGIMVVNLPVAFPYFAAIAAIVGSGRGLASQSACIVLYSLCFVAPLLGIVGVLWLAPDRSEALLSRLRQLIQRHWAGALAVVLVLAGAFVMVLGLTGVAAGGDGHFGHFARHVHHLLS